MARLMIIKAVALQIAMVSIAAAADTSTEAASSNALPTLETTSASVTTSSSAVVVTSGSSTYTSVSKSTITTSMPSYSSTASSSAASSTSSSVDYSFTATIPTSDIKNPYISTDTSPNGTMFISFGAVIAAVFVAFFGFLLLSFLISRLRKSSNTSDLFDDYEDKNFPYDPSIFGNYDRGHDGSTIADFNSDEKKTTAASVYSVGGTSTLNSNVLLAPGTIDDCATTVLQQGRSLRNALISQNNSSQAINYSQPNKSNRKSKVISMYISPLEEAMNQSQLGLQPPNTSYDPNNSSYGSPVSSSFISSTVENSPMLEAEENKRATRRLSGLDWYEAYQQQTQQVQSSQQQETAKKKIRPPSMALDDLMDQAFDD